MNKLLAFALGFFFIPMTHAETPRIAIVTQDQVSLRSAPRDSSKHHATLWQGEAVEVRGERMDYVQVYDYRRERAGFMHASRLRRVALQPSDAPELLSVVR